MTVSESKPRRVVVWTILYLILGIIFLYFWMKLRESRIRSQCVDEAMETGAGADPYRECLARHGLTPPKNGE